MSTTGRLSRIVLVCLFALLWACHAKPPGAEEPVKKGGVFSDVIEAIGQVEQTLPKTGERDKDVPRDEWKLIVAARERFEVPPSETQTPTEGDYNDPGAGDTGGSVDNTQGDALDVILDAEWDEYRNLSASVLPGTPDPELLKAAQDSLSDFYRDLPELMSAVPDTLRERVLHIVVLRYFNTILRAGVDPRLFAVMQPR
jgi:hypothetical protein